MKTSVQNNIRKTIITFMFVFACTLIPHDVTHAGLTDGLVGHWTFDGKDTPWTSSSAGTAIDKSGNGNTGTLTSMNRSISPAKGKVGQGLKFDGVDDYVDAGTAAVLKPAFPFSISTWVMLPTGGSSMNIDTSAAPNGEYSGYVLGISSSNIVAQTGDNTGTCSSSFRNTVVTTATTLNTNQWYHVTAIFTNATSFSIFLNGSSVATTQTGNAGLNIGYAAGAHLNIGRIYGGCAGSYAYSGSVVDEVRIYNRALSATEIQQLYKLGGNKVGVTPAPIASSTSSTGLVGHWTFDGKDTPWTSSSAGTAIDKSGNGNTGTLTSMNRSTSPTKGKLGQGLNFDGVNDYVITNLTAHYSQTTFSAWIYPRTLGEGNLGRIFDKRENGGTETFFLAMSAGTNKLLLQRAFSTYGSWNSPNSSIVLNAWNHIVVTYDESSTANDPLFYINGISVAVSELVAPSGTIVTNADRYIIGNRGDTTRTFNGIIDDVRIYNRALSATEIKQLYALGQTKVR